MSDQDDQRKNLGGYKPRKNIKVTDSQRMQLLDLIHNQKYSITKAASISNINYENAKLINQVYVKHGRFQKITKKRQKHGANDQAEQE